MQKIIEIFILKSIIDCKKNNIINILSKRNIKTLKFYLSYESYINILNSY
jgi:hypothetical protein